MVAIKVGRMNQGKHLNLPYEEVFFSECFGNLIGEKEATADDEESIEGRLQSSMSYGRWLLPCKLEAFTALFALASVFSLRISFATEVHSQVLQAIGLKMVHI